MKQDQLIIRPATPTDHAFIFATYLRNRWFSPDNTTTLQKNTWMKVMHKRLEKILAEQNVLIAGLAGDLDTVLGYRFKDGSQDWLYVKAAWRDPKFNIKKSLEEANL
jgi:hypothetical protein